MEAEREPPVKGSSRIRHGKAAAKPSGSCTSRCSLAIINAACTLVNQRLGAPHNSISKSLVKWAFCCSKIFLKYHSFAQVSLPWSSAASIMGVCECWIRFCIRGLLNEGPTATHSHAHMAFSPMTVCQVLEPLATTGVVQYK